jgi:hypothetical protein
MAASKSTTEQDNMALTSKDSAKYFGELSFADLMAKKAEADALNAQLAAALETKKVEELKVLTDAFAKKLIAGAFDIDEAKDILDLYKPAKAGRKPRAAKGSKPEKEYKDKDSTGARPEAGKTYVLNGVEWTKAASGLGAAKKEFIAAIQSGTKWAELAAK